MWMKVDDQLHAHRKTRAVARSHGEKRRDLAPLGLWITAGSWAGQNRTDGWVPVDELDRWDDDWERLAQRLVNAGFWWPEVRDGEAGYRFNDWHDYNDPADLASKSGSYGNHVRWHVNQGQNDPLCAHCSGAIAPPSPPDSPPDSGGESRSASGAIALPEPEPEPGPEPSSTSSSATADADRGTELDPMAQFEEFWGVYGKKVDRKTAEQKWRLAMKKPGVDADRLIAAARTYVTWTRQNDGPQFVMDPARWLNGERWTDEIARSTADAPYRPLPHQTRKPPDGLTDAQYDEWRRDPDAFVERRVSPDLLHESAPSGLDAQGYSEWHADWRRRCREAREGVAKAGPT